MLVNFEIIYFLVSTVLFKNAFGHGMMLIPPNRSSLWRFFKDAPINYNDNQNFCGGFSVQWYQNKGKCGVCGDNYADATPRNNENGGKYGNGIVTAQYLSGSVISVDVLLTANHKGYFDYSLCALDNHSAPESENCFENLQLIDGTYSYPVDSSINQYTNYIQLPQNLTCERCVLRWHYNTGNSWGICPNGIGGIGCGAQETFRSCSDIRIVENEHGLDNKISETYERVSSRIVSVLKEI